MDGRLPERSTLRQRHVAAHGRGWLPGHRTPGGGPGSHGQWAARMAGQLHGQVAGRGHAIGDRLAGLHSGGLLRAGLHLAGARSGVRPAGVRLAGAGLAGLHLAGARLAAVPAIGVRLLASGVTGFHVTVSPSLTDLPGSKALGSLVNGIAAWALMLALAGLLIGAAMWALGSHSQNYQQSYTGKRAVLVSALAALLIGVAPVLINFFFRTGSGIPNPLDP